MEKLRLNIDNAGYYSEAFIKGWKTGVEAQFNADVREQRPKGEWLYKDLGHVEYSAVCPECGDWTFTKSDIEDGYVNANFCPNCGADMRGCKE